MMQITTNGSILLNGKDTGLGFKQSPDATVIFTREDQIAGLKYQEHKMPHAKYSAVADAPESGAAGRGQLEADINDLLVRLGFE